MPCHIVKWFRYDHLPAGPVQEVSKSFHELAVKLDGYLPDSAEKTAGMRKLLEAKDCHVRATIEVIEDAKKRG